jgi:hypothetical protein
MTGVAAMEPAPPAAPPDMIAENGPAGAADAGVRREA